MSFSCDQNKSLKVVLFTLNLFTCVVTDKLTKSAHFIKCKGSTITAVDAARMYFDHVYRYHGLPDVLVSDRDVRFVSGFWKELFRLCDTKFNMSTAHHAQTDGQTERLNRTLEDMLRNFLNFRMNNWTTLLPTLEFAYNSAKQESTGHSPFYLNCGYEPRTVLDVLNPDIQILKSTAAGKYLETLQAVSHEVRDQLLSAQLNQARYANRSRRDESFRVGDLASVS